MFNWFKKKGPDNYEEILSSLALDIQKRQQQLADIRLRERRATLLVTIYAFAAWVAYAAFWYSGLMPLHGDAIVRVPQVFLVFLGPILIQFTRRLVQTWYTRKENAEEKTLKTLLSQQRSKVEEIKKKTNYYSTKNLIEKYDSSPADSPLHQRPGAGQKPIQPPGTPQRSGQPTPNAAPRNTPMASASGVLPLAPITPGRKLWYDKLADALLGDDEMSMNAAANKYALICQKCFTHNGLVKEELWQDTQYVCPKCGYFNPSPRSLRSGQTVSPASPVSPELNSQALPAQPRLRPEKGRQSMPANFGQSLSQPSVAGSDRRKSMPSRSGPLLEEDEHQQQPGKRSPLANLVALPEDDSLVKGKDDEETAEGDVSTEGTKASERTALMEVDS